MLFGCKVTGNNQPHILRLFAFFQILKDTNMFGAGSVAGFAIDAGLTPGGAVGIRRQIVIGTQLADMATVTAGIKGEHRIFPGQHFIVRVIVAKIPYR
jgi:hypothetical protein